MSDKKPDPWFEIAGYDGKILKLFKRGGYWQYKLRPGEIRTTVALELAERVKANWGVLGVAWFESITEKILKLKRIAL